MVFNLSQPIKSCGTRTDPAAETESIGLPVDASASWRSSVFCSPFIMYTLIREFLTVYRDSNARDFYLDRRNCIHLPGLAKNSPTLTPLLHRGRLPATQLNRRAVIVHWRKKMPQILLLFFQRHFSQNPTNATSRVHAKNFSQF